MWFGLALSTALSGAWLVSQAGPHANDTLRAATIILRPGEDLEAAALRGGVGRDDAAAAARLIAESAPAGMLAGTPLHIALAEGRNGGRRLMALWIGGGQGAAPSLTLGYDGRYRLGADQRAVRDVVTVADLPIAGSVLDTAEQAGADPALIGEATRLLAARLDFARDIRPGDRLRLVFVRRTTAAGATVQTGALVYAEVVARVGGVKLFAFNDHGHTEFLDAQGRSGQAQLLRTPVAGARITSPFGMRSHPILGFTRVHQGVDFAAASGTPILAAGDGVVVEARPWGGYGNWLRIRHAGGWETGYAHMAGYAAGISPGSRVRQGEVVGYVGRTGLTTGSHLHFELWEGGVRVDPARSPPVAAPTLDLEGMARFAVQRGRIERLLALASRGAPPLQPPESVENARLDAASPSRDGLRLVRL